MSKVQERGLLDALGDAEGLARVLRAMSDGRLDLVPVAGSGMGIVQPLSFAAARTEASRIAGTLPSSAGDGVLTRVQETFCSVCGHLGEPGVHSQPDCPRYVSGYTGGNPDLASAWNLTEAQRRWLREAQAGAPVPRSLEDGQK